LENDGNKEEESSPKNKPKEIVKEETPFKMKSKLNKELELYPD